MKYQDKVYGSSNITEPIVLEILNSPALKRLKDIDQGGYGPLCVKPYAQPGQFGHNRLAHSVGVYLLLKRYSAPLAEQIAGLVHDVSHSAFSHCIDYVLATGNGKKQNHQDNSHNSFVRQTDIPKILKKYKFDLAYILNDKNFSLKEKALPDLCADRIDYILREGLIFKEITGSQIKAILNNFVIIDNDWVFKNFKSAKKFAQLFLKLNREYYAGVHAATMFKIVSDYLKYALAKKYITITDLYTTDKIVLAKIRRYLGQDKDLSLLWWRMEGKIKVRQNSKNYDARIFCKSRIVDPLFMDQNKIKRLSEAEPGWSKIVRQELKPKEYFLKFEK